MDDNRIVTGLSNPAQSGAEVRQPAELRNDLEDAGGNAYQPFEGERDRALERRKDRPRPAPRAVEDPPTTPLEDSLDRIAHTDARIEAEVQDARRWRGLHHYRERDPETSGFYRRRRSPPTEPSDS